MYATLEHIFQVSVRYIILLLEAVGAIIIVIHAVQAMANLFSNRHRSRTLLAEGITMALSFLLGSEVLKTIIAPDWKDIGMTCAVLLMRAAMTVLLHWETAHEPKDISSNAKE